MDFGPHATFIIAAYAAVIIVLGGLIVWLIFDGFHQRRLLNELEARGVRRRSAQRVSRGRLDHE
ncbi:heme exporter protein D [Filomicrobium insigne]|uniref:Heme exporter protein D n=1 Tax=Filomicrobium insigne TaxID=418854 RepID=A0A1H0J8S4_9HYPH|nr:heme exporter protein CcmD [Filomicrobium insigne]SDO39879.1 heme exporter protein D [Filomicrobium insigne]